MAACHWVSWGAAYEFVRLVGGGSSPLLGSWLCMCVAVVLVWGGGSPWLCMLSPAGWLPRVQDQLPPYARLRVWVPLPLPFYCGTQPWNGLHSFITVCMLRQCYTLCGLVKWVSVVGLSNSTANNTSLQVYSQPKLVCLVWESAAT